MQCQLSHGVFLNVSSSDDDDPLLSSAAAGIPDLANPANPPHQNEEAEVSSEEETTSIAAPHLKDDDSVDTIDDDPGYYFSPDNSHFEDCFEDKEGDLPMYETESSSSCANDYKPFLDPDGVGSEPLPICTLLEWYEALIASGYSQLSVPPNVIAKIQLLVLLTKAIAPLHMYIQILKWVTSSMDAGTNFRSSEFIGKAATREGLLDVLNKRYAFQAKCFPTSQAVTLRKAQVKFNAIYFNFLEQMYSLLMDNILMQSDNLLFHNDNPFSPPPKQDPPVLHNIKNDGSLYRNAYHKYVKNPSLDLLCGLIFFIDSTHLSVNGRLILEPVTMTLSIFKKEV
jgi:hypothetical protein